MGACICVNEGLSSVIIREAIFKNNCNLLIILTRIQLLRLERRHIYFINYYCVIIADCCLLYFNIFLYGFMIL